VVASESRVRPKFGFSAETDLTYGFSLISATAKVHCSSLSHSLPRRVVCHPGHPVPTIMGGVVLVQPSVRMLRFGSVSATVTAVSHQFRLLFRLRP